MYRHRVHDLYLLKWDLGVLWFSLLCPRWATRVQVISVLFSLALVFRETLERWLTHGLWFLVLLQSNPSSAWQLCLPVPIRGSLTSHQHTHFPKQGEQSSSPSAISVIKWNHAHWAGVRQAWSIRSTQETEGGGWRNGSMVKSICWSYREPGFYSLHSYGSSQSLLILIPGDPLPSSGFVGTRDTCDTHTYMQANAHSRIKQKQQQWEVLTIHDRDNDGDEDNGGDDGLW